ncbi:hypothetical protein HPB51_001262 [Rhipicephalus microplus]|uniref:Concentrative nucleoside transporter N-terminal domain-containing protein n=1 Tax=Rhipicephalus microplus TaxID=6941 RepID=A0A9J6E5Z3_RHIMP|nr:hypothetical protein HPB51_001262 [Rhipicephalus microplus]
MARPWQRSLDIMPPSRKGSMPEEPPGAELYPTKLSVGEVNPAFHDDTCADATEMQSPVSLGSTSAHCGRADCSSQRSASPLSEKTPWKKRLPFFTKVAVAVLFHAYLAAGISLTWSSTPDYCHDVKFLTVVTAIGYVYVLWCVVCALLGKTGAVCDAYQSLRDRITVTWVKSRLLRPCTWLLVWLCLLSFLVYDSIKDIQRLISLAGIVVLLLIGFIFSNARFRVDWYQVMWGLLLQFLLGLVVLRWSHGRDALQCLANKVKNFLDYTNSGSHFVFGHLASGWNLTEALGDLVPKKT